MEILLCFLELEGSLLLQVLLQMELAYDVHFHLLERNLGRVVQSPVSLLALDELHRVLHPHCSYKNLLTEAQGRLFPAFALHE